MKKIIAAVAILMVSGLFFSMSLSAEEKLAGTWQTIADEGVDKGKAKSYLDIYEVNGAYVAKITKLLINKEKDPKCDKCKDALKDKPIIGMIIMRNMKKTGKIDKDFGVEYAGGQILDPDNGNYYKCKIWVKGDKLVVRGYLAFFYRTQYWYRVK